ncbi:MAG: transposase [Saprospiraceae bacterium]
MCPRTSMRARWWDYGCDALYFVTLVTKNRRQYFGDVIDGKMELSHVGIIADILWTEIKYHSTHVILHQYVIMPDHLHGIIELKGNKPKPDVFVDPHSSEIASMRYQNQGKNTLSSITGSYRSAVSKHAHRLGFDFEWQLRCHDHIIRNDGEYNRISKYILNNPLHWEKDDFLRLFDEGD